MGRMGFRHRFMTRRAVLSDLDQFVGEMVERTNQMNERIEQLSMTNEMQSETIKAARKLLGLLKQETENGDRVAVIFVRDGEFTQEMNEALTRLHNLLTGLEMPIDELIKGYEE